jgi:glycine dehydrogenase
MNLFEAQQAEFQARHIGPNEHDTRKMLHTIGESSLQSLVDKTVPPAIRMKKPLNIPAAMSEHDYLQHIKDISPKEPGFQNLYWPGLLR